MPTSQMPPRPTQNQPDVLLLVRVSRQGGGLEVHCQTCTPAGPWVDHGVTKPNHDATTILDAYFGDIESKSTGKRVAPELQGGIGISVTRDLLPSSLIEFLQGIRRADGRPPRLFIVSNETWVPWELMRFAASGDATDSESKGRFFAESFVMTQWLAETPETLRQHQPATRLTRSRAAVVVPSDSNLPSAQEEQRSLLAIDPASEVVEATLQGVRQAITSGAYDGWHFAGHGWQSRSGADLASLVLEGRAQFKAAELPEHEQAFGKKRPFVFLNSCHSGKGTLGMTGIGGWSARFVEAGAGAFLGPRWAVSDQASSMFSTEVYERWLKGMPLAEAVYEARLVIRDEFESNATWLAYATFASLDARRVQEGDAGALRPVDSTADPAIEKAIQRLEEQRLGEGSTTSRWLAWALVALAVLILIGVVTISRDSETPPRPGVAVLTFENLSNDPSLAWLNTALAEGVERQLTVDQHVWVADRQRTVIIEGALNQRSSLEPSDLRRLQDELGVDQVITGSFTKAADGARVSVTLTAYPKALDVPVQSVTESVTGSPANWLDLTFDLVSPTIRDAVTGSSQAPSYQDRQAVEASVPTALPAASEYMSGLQRWRRFDQAEALAHFRRATQGDDLHPLALAERADLERSAGLSAATETIEAALTAVERRRGTSSELPSLWEAKIEAIAGKILPEVAGRPAGQRTVDALGRLYREHKPHDIGQGLLWVDALIDTARLDDALLIIGELQDLPGADKQASLAYAEAEAWFELQRYEEALTAATAAAELAQANTLPRLEGLARLLIVSVYSGQTNDAAAEEALSEAEVALRQSRPQDRRALANALELKATFHSTADPVAVQREAIELYRQIGAVDAEVQASIELAAIFIEYGDADAASAQLEAAKARGEGLWSKDTEGSFQALQGTLLQIQGRFSKAYEQLLESLEIAERNGDTVWRATLLTNLGEMQYFLGNLNAASDLHHDALELADGSDIDYDTRYDSMRLGRVAALRGDVAGARERYAAVVASPATPPEARDYNTLQLLAETALARAEILHLEGRNEDAKRWLKSAFEAVEEEGYDDFAARLESLQARIALDENQLAEAQAVMQSARGRQLLDFRARFEVDLGTALVTAAEGRVAAGIEQLEQLAAQATAGGIVLYEHEARLAIGTVELQVGRGPETVSALYRDACSRKFEQTKQRIQKLLRAHDRQPLECPPLGLPSTN